MKKLFRMLIMATVAVASIIGCAKAQADNGPIKEAIWAQADRIEYYFGDSSTPPDYHRSYSLTVTKTEARIVVDSYGTTLLDKTYKLKSGQFAKVVAELQKLGIRSKKKQEGTPCSGGTTESFYLYAGKEKLFNGYQDNCEERLSTMVVGTEAIPRVLETVFPKTIDELVDSTRKH